MSTGDATVAERYARAIFDLGIQASEVGTIVARIEAFAAVYRGSTELRVVLENPRIQAAERDAVLRAMAERFGFSPLGLNALRYIARRRRLRALPEIAARLRSLADEREGTLRAVVSVAAPLPESFYERLTRELESLTGRRILLERREDPSLLAGVVTRIGDKTIDGSLRGRLERLGRQLESS